MTLLKILCRRIRRGRFLRGGYLFSSAGLLVLSAPVMYGEPYQSWLEWRILCLLLPAGAVLYEAIWRSECQAGEKGSLLLVALALQWFPALLLCSLLSLCVVLKSFVLFQWSPSGLSYVVTLLPYTLWVGGIFSISQVSGTWLWITGKSG